MRVSYDPRTCGAECDRCPLGPRGALRDAEGPPWAPVGPEWHGAAVLTVVDHPQDEDVGPGRPLTGRAGLDVWNPALLAIGKRRDQVSLTHALACVPPGSGGSLFKKMERRLKRENERREEDGEDPLPHPLDCCLPRLQREVASTNSIILLGTVAARAVLNSTQGATVIRGGPRELATTVPGIMRKVLPTVHPSFVLHKPQWFQVFASDLGKAFRWFDNQRNWLEPSYLWRPTPDQLRAWLAAPGRFVSYDYETDSFEGLRANVDCIGLARVEDHPKLEPCDKCGSTGRRVQVLSIGRGWLPAPPDERHLACPACEGRGQRVIDTRTCLVPFRSVAPETKGQRFYTDADERDIREQLRAAMADPAKCWTAHNGLAYDEYVNHQFLRVSIANRLDTMAMARSRAPDLPKGLGVIGSLLTDVHAWKADNDGNKIATHAKDDPQLHYYCAIDAAVTARVTDPLVNMAAAQGYFRPLREDVKPPSWPARLPWTLAGLDVYRSEMCQEMHYNGLYIDEDRRQAHGRDLLKEINQHRATAVAYAKKLGIHGPTKSKKRGPEPFNPGSNKQVAEVLFEKWGFKPERFSEETGEPAVDDDMLRSALCSVLDEYGEASEQYSFMDALRRYKRARKAKATFIDAMDRGHLWQPKWGKDNKITAWTRDGVERTRRPIAWEDGCVRASASAILTSVSRLNMSDGLQQIPEQYRDMFCARPGQILIGGDVDQFHLRIIANRWRVARLLEAFHTGIDPHSALAYDFFGAKYKHADGWGPNGFSLLQKDSPAKDSSAGKMRQMGKVMRYRGAYADTPEGLHQSVIKVENKKTGELPFRHVTVREVARLYKIWMRAEPEWETAWQDCMDLYTRNGGWLEEALFGRRSGVLEGGKLQAVVNFMILAEEPAIFSLMEANIRAAFPFGHAGEGTGFVHQGHDAANIATTGNAWWVKRGDKWKVECDEATERKRRTLEECMTIRIPGCEVPYTAGAKVGPVWGKDGKPCLSNWRDA